MSETKQNSRVARRCGASSETRGQPASRSARHPTGTQVSWPTIAQASHTYYQHGLRKRKHTCPPSALQTGWQCLCATSSMHSRSVWRAVVSSECHFAVHALLVIHTCNAFLQAGAFHAWDVYLVEAWPFAVALAFAAARSQPSICMSTHVLFQQCLSGAHVYS